MANNVKNYIDFDLNFIPHPVTGDINKKYDIDSIKNSIVNLILTKPYERPYQPALNCNITSLLFEPISEPLKEAISITITEVLNNYEPRIKLKDIRVLESAANGFDVYLFFIIKNTAREEELNLFLERLS